MNNQQKVQIQLDEQDGITYIHFREIPKDGLKKSHIEVLLGPERARTDEINAYEKIIKDRKKDVRSWSISEVCCCVPELDLICEKKYC
jgi:hypothetical protein